MSTHHLLNADLADLAIFHIQNIFSPLYIFSHVRKYLSDRKKRKLKIVFYCFARHNSSMEIFDIVSVLFSQYCADMFLSSPHTGWLPASCN